MLLKASFVSVKLNGDDKTAYKDWIKFGHPHFLDFYFIYLFSFILFVSDLNSGVCLRMILLHHSSLSAVHP